MTNNLIDTTMTEVTPYKKAVVELYKTLRADKDSITVDINDEYTERLKSQLSDFKEVIKKNIEKAEEQKAALNKTLDEMDADFMKRVEAENSSPEDIDALVNDVFNQGYAESNKVTLIEKFIETKNTELQAIDDMIKEVDEKSDALQKSIVGAKLVVNMIHDITKDEAMVSLWKDDFAKIQEKSKEDDCEDWITILRYCTSTKAKLEVLDLQKKMNETVQALLSAYNEYVKDEDAQKIETLPEINWYGQNRSARYKEFDTVISYMRDKLYKTYLENQANLSNEKLKEIKSLIFNTDYLCLSKELRDSRLIAATSIPDPVTRYAYRVNMLARPIMEGLYSGLIDNAYEFSLYTMSIVREPNAFWLVFLLAGEM